MQNCMFPVNRTGMLTSYPSRSRKFKISVRDGLSNRKICPRKSYRTVYLLNRIERWNRSPPFRQVKSLGNENAVYSTRKSPHAERKARHRRRVRLLRRRTDFSNLFVVRRASYVVGKARYSYFQLLGTYHFLKLCSPDGQPRGQTSRLTISLSLLYITRALQKVFIPS